MSRKCVIAGDTFPIARKDERGRELSFHVLSCQFANVEIEFEDTAGKSLAIVSWSERFDTVGKVCPILDHFPLVSCLYRFAAAFKRLPGLGGLRSD